MLAGEDREGEHLPHHAAARPGRRPRPQDAASAPANAPREAPWRPAVSGGAAGFDAKRLAAGMTGITVLMPSAPPRLPARPRTAGRRVGRTARETAACAALPACAGAAGRFDDGLHPARAAALITATRSERKTASAIEWVTSSVVVARSVQIRCSSRLSRWRVISSSAPNGSSSSSIVGFDHQRAGDRHALAHAAGELGRPGRLEALEADQLDQVGDGVGADLHPADLERQPDVGRDGAPRQQRRVLEGDAELVLAADRRRAIRRAPAPCRTVGVLQVGEDAQHRRLAAAGRPEQGQELALAARTD